MIDSLEHGLEPGDVKGKGETVGVGIDEYRAVFESDVGRKVLAHILTEMGYFKVGNTSPEALALNNQAKRILECCGVLKRMSGPGDANAVKNYENIVNALLSVSVETKG